MTKVICSMNNQNLETDMEIQIEDQKKQSSQH